MFDAIGTNMNYFENGQFDLAETKELISAEMLFIN